VRKLWVACVVSVAVLGALCGCGSQDEVIGRGPAALVFTGDGDDSVNIEVTWEEDNGQWVSRDFTLYPLGRVEVRLADRLNYYVSVDASASSSSAQENGVPQNEVLTLDQGEPCDPPKGQMGMSIQR